MQTLEILHGPESYSLECLTPMRPKRRIEEPPPRALNQGREFIQLTNAPEVKRPAASPKPAPPTPEMLRLLRKPASRGEVPEARVRYSEVYSSTHEKLLLRAEHIEKMDAVRKAFNKRRVHGGQRSLTSSDLVNACLDFAFEHPVPFDQLKDADQVLALLRRSIYLSAIRRWQEFNEAF